MGNTRSKHLSHKLFNISRKQDRKKKKQAKIVPIICGAFFAIRKKKKKKKKKQAYNKIFPSSNISISGNLNPNNKKKKKRIR